MSNNDSFSRLREIIETLTGPDGCPWDREQTPLSLCDYVVEEAFELVEAVRSGNADEAREELGDVLFLLLFIAHLYERQGEFRIEEAMDENRAKMIRRHPHVFSDTEFKDQAELLRAWERIKRSEKTDVQGTLPGVFDSLPKGLPPLLKSYRIHSKAARAGFTWESDADLERQLESEWAEWREAEASGDAEAMEREFGDYLFTLVELGRRKGIKANAALDFANRKFLSRFGHMERSAKAEGKELADMDLESMNALWDKAKSGERD
ncbi:nucleoside triphosphate pyrophosphohydrolase [Paucidesulfovibrio longus]|uniref:nucleoside triphosphate pyrophosphohydrolase n=1 Tax=Paucidesulfovibrio longus TaxID=889 RepID=UPI0003B4F023|nr:nucleoside triphosphate pyrophosphohydrolase [Paucidesulfovibrio longus]